MTGREKTINGTLSTNPLDKEVAQIILEARNHYKYHLMYAFGNNGVESK